MKEEDIQSKYMELQMIQQQLGQIEQRKEALQNQSQEFLKLKVNLEDLKKTKKDSMMYSALGSGVYVKAELKETNNVLVNVGSGVVVEKSIEDSAKMVESQIKELREILKRLEEDSIKGSKRASQINKELSQLQHKEHKK